MPDETNLIRDDSQEQAKTSDTVNHITEPLDPASLEVTETSMS